MDFFRSNEFLLSKKLDEKNLQELDQLQDLTAEDAIDVDLDDEDESNYEDSIFRRVPTMKPLIVNIVAIAEFNTTFDLEAISRQLRNVTYNPRRFQAAVIHIQEPKATAMIFAKGKVNILGTKTEDNAQLAFKKFGRILRNAGYPKLRSKSFQISNIAALINTQFQIRLDGMSREEAYRPFTTYNPEIFSGLIYKYPLPDLNEKGKPRRLTLLVWKSGKIMMMGARNRAELDKAAQKMFPILEGFKLQVNPAESS